MKTTGEQIQTLHPVEGKVNKKISLDKYNFIRDHIMEILKDGALSHLALMEELYSRVKDDFDGGVQWYGEVVKLDLEAREVIVRRKTNPVLYSLKSSIVAD